MANFVVCLRVWRCGRVALWPVWPRTVGFTMAPCVCGAVAVWPRTCGCVWFLGCVWLCGRCGELCRVCGCARVCGCVWPVWCGRVGHRRLHTTKGGPATGPPFSHPHHTGHTATHTAMRTPGHREHPPHPDPKNHTHGHTGHREPHHKRRLLPAPHTPIAGMLVGPDLFALRHKGKNLLC